MLQAVGGPGQGYTWTLLLSSLDTDCLLLSNQAKLEAKLESNHAATVSKLDRGIALSYHTPTQECLVAKTGAETCTNLYQIPAWFSQGKTVTGTLKVGAAVTSIGDRAFYNTDLTELDLSEATALQTIGWGAFYNNPQLTGTLKVGPAVTSIGAYAFANTKLTGIDLSDATALTTIGEGAFYKNGQLTGTLKVGPAVTSIGQYAFYNTQITGIDLSEATALTTIENFAFSYTGLTDIDLSVATALETIGDGAFSGTPLAGKTVIKADGTPITLS